MQMENIFNKITIPRYFFNDISFVMSDDLWFYLKDNLQKENNDILRWDLKTALKINANGEYIY
jgi:hypothetical protein